MSLKAGKTLFNTILCIPLSIHLTIPEKSKSYAFQDYNPHDMSAK